MLSQGQPPLRCMPCMVLTFPQSLPSHPQSDLWYWYIFRLSKHTPWFWNYTENCRCNLFRSATPVWCRPCLSDRFLCKNRMCPTSMIFSGGSTPPWNNTLCRCLSGHICRLSLSVNGWCTRSGMLWGTFAGHPMRWHSPARRWFFSLWRYIFRHAIPYPQMQTQDMPWLSAPVIQNHTGTLFPPTPRHWELLCICWIVLPFQPLWWHIRPFWCVYNILLLTGQPTLPLPDNWTTTLCLRNPVSWWFPCPWIRTMFRFFSFCR